MIYRKYKGFSQQVEDLVVDIKSFLRKESRNLDKRSVEMIKDCIDSMQFFARVLYAFGEDAFGEDD